MLQLYAKTKKGTPPHLRFFLISFVSVNSRILKNPVKHLVVRSVFPEELSFASLGMVQ